MEKRKLAIRDEYITLTQLLKLTGIIQTGGEAKHFLQANEVRVNGQLENRRGRKIYPGDEVWVEGRGIFSVEKN